MTLFSKRKFDSEAFWGCLIYTAGAVAVTYATLSWVQGWVFQSLLLAGVAVLVAVGFGYSDD